MNCGWMWNLVARVVTNRLTKVVKVTEGSGKFCIHYPRQMFSLYKNTESKSLSRLLRKLSC
jgi:hypothetical protein